MIMTKILFFAGSAREQSLSKKLAKAAHDMAASNGVEATFIDLKDYPLPLYDGDLEQANGLPKNAEELIKIFADHDGFFITSPEYNSSYSPLFKNTIDWISRGGSDHPEPYKGKVAAIAASSPGGLGGMRVLVPLRMLLSNIGIHVVPNQASVNFAGKAFNDDGSLANENQLGLVNAALDQLISTANSLNN